MSIKSNSHALKSRKFFETTKSGDTFGEGANLPFHGGDIYSASENYGTPIDQWLDLSTGINPRSYNFNPIGKQFFEQLPYVCPAFLKAASAYYQCSKLLPVAGSQAVIERLPFCLPQGNLWVPDVGYQEYSHQWLQQGRSLFSYPSLCRDKATASISTAIRLGEIDHLLVINPNNPTGLCFSTEQLTQWAKALEAGGGMLIVDEAFVDIRPESSLLRNDKSLPDNVIVLRSFGKFFGLAGLRLGFVMANKALLEGFAALFGPWAVNGIAQQVAMQAFQDDAWQQDARDLIAKDQLFTQAILQPLFIRFQMIQTPGLFSVYCLPAALAENIREVFSQQGILLRIIPMTSEECLVRVGNIRVGDAVGENTLALAVEFAIEHLPLNIL